MCLLRSRSKAAALARRRRCDRSVCALRAAEEPAEFKSQEQSSSLSEAEAMFKEAFEAEAERIQLLSNQLEDALVGKLQQDGDDTGVKIVIETATPLSPLEPGGKATWKEAYQASKTKAEQLEAKLKKTQGLGVPAAAPPPPPPPAETAQTTTSTPTSTQSNNSGSPFPFLGGVGPIDQQAVLKIEELAQNTIEDENLLRTIAQPILGQKPPEEMTTSLPPASRVRETVGNDMFAIRESIEFSRVYVFKGSISAGAEPGTVLDTLQRRLAESSIGSNSELFLSKTKEEGRSLLVVMLKEDLPSSEFAWWQWILVAFCLLATLLSVNATTFSVATMTLSELQSMDAGNVMNIASKTIPTAISVFSTVASMEAARRAAAAKYNVDLTPPFFMPVWPFPSVGCLGAITRRLSLAPNQEASVVISAAAGMAGLIVSTAILCAGIAMGPDPDKIVNLNFQMVPLLLKLILKPFLGQTTLTDQPDAFADPVSLAFPANGVLIGGIIGLIVTALNLLPIGRLDGGNLIKTVLGGRVGGLVGFGALFLCLFGSSGPSEAGLLYVTFLFYALVFQSGSELPPRDGVSELDEGVKLLALLLVIIGALLSIPGSLFPFI